MFDCHLHTEFSTDSKMKIEEAIAKAKALNLGLVLTEHLDINYPEKDLFIFDVQEYFKAYAPYRGEKLLLGVEIGMQLNCVEEASFIVKNNAFDQVIGSIHLVNGMDLFWKSFYEGKSKKEAYEEYFAEMLKNLNLFDCIDTLGHIDYIARYADLPDKELYYEEFSESIDNVLSFLIKNEKALEINTKRIIDPGVLEAVIKIYKRYKELGGSLVTVGSDAHKADNIGKEFQLVKKIVTELEFKPVYFKNRRPEYSF